MTELLHTGLASREPDALDSDIEAILRGGGAGARGRSRFIKVAMLPAMLVAIGSAGIFLAVPELRMPSEPGPSRGSMPAEARDDQLRSVQPSAGSVLKPREFSGSATPSATVGPERHWTGANRSYAGRRLHRRGSVTTASSRTGAPVRVVVEPNAKSRGGMAPLRAQASAGPDSLRASATPRAQQPGATVDPPAPPPAVVASQRAPVPERAAPVGQVAVAQRQPNGTAAPSAESRGDTALVEPPRESNGVIAKARSVRSRRLLGIDSIRALRRN